MSPAPVTTFHISRAGWVGLAVLFVLPWAGVVWLARDAAKPAPPPPARIAVAATSANPPLATGPWGHLEFSRIVIEPPEDYVPVDYTAPDAVRWVFRGYTPARLDELWQRAGLTAAQRQSLADPARLQATAEGVTLKPDLQLVVDLAPEARATIYLALAEFPENAPQRDPFRLRAEAAKDWFDDSGISPPILDLTRRMLYTRNNTVMFSDADVVLPKIGSSAERVRFIKTLSRKSTMLVQLVVAHGADVEPLARYWGRGRRNKDVLPLLQSLARRPQGGAVDVVHLMPPFPRSLLYTYPLSTSRPGDTARDCHWSSFNFNKEKADERYLNLDFVRQSLDNDYYVVAGQPELGDVLVFVRPDGVVVHSCVYVAADVVFTKNGASFSVPWLLGNLDSVLSFYATNGPLEVRRFRPKEQ